MRKILDTLLRYLPYILLFGFIFLFGKKLFNGISSFLGESTEQKQEYKETESAKIKIANQTKKNATLTDAEAMNIADELYHDLLENSTEDEKDVIAQIKKLKHSADWNLVDAKFGVREDNAYLKSFKGTLSQAIREYVDSDNLVIIRTYLKGIGVNI